jgi:hypothetical protein
MRTNPEAPERTADMDPELAALLRAYAAPAPPPGLFDTAVQHALRVHRRNAQRRARPVGLRAAVAAGAAVLATGLVLRFALWPSNVVPTVSVNVNEPETVRLVFAADDPLEEATMTVRLPPGVELEGFPGEREIRWATSLAEGRNLLPLTLIVTAPGTREIEARLEHESRDRTFRLRIDAG